MMRGIGLAVSLLCVSGYVFADAKEITPGVTMDSPKMVWSARLATSSEYSAVRDAAKNETEAKAIANAVGRAQLDNRSKMEDACEEASKKAGFLGNLVHGAAIRIPPPSASSTFPTGYKVESTADCVGVASR